MATALPEGLHEADHGRHEHQQEQQQARNLDQRGDGTAESIDSKLGPHTAASHVEAQAGQEATDE